MSVPPPPPGGPFAQGPQDDPDWRPSDGHHQPFPPPPDAHPHLAPDRPPVGGSRGWGIAVGLLSPILLGILAGSLSTVSPEVANAIVPLALVASVVLAVNRSTRRFGVGVLLGMGLVIIITAGACLALIAFFASQMG